VVQHDEGVWLIKPDDRKNDLFFHVRNFPFGKIPEPCLRVAYDIGPDASGRPQAVSGIMVGGSIADRVGYPLPHGASQRDFLP
jgi:hypothetical protein